MKQTGIENWRKSSFTAVNLTRDVYRRGIGPVVVIVHEIPGITPAVEKFASDVVDAGFTVVMPNLVGTPGKVASGSYMASSMLKVCVSREFTNMALDKTSPIIAWLRALARSLHMEVGGKGVGAIGMCFSGGFALAMMVDDIMIAPVLSQPSMPFSIGKDRSRDLNLSPEDAIVVRQRAQDGCQVLGLRFDKDKLVGDRFAALQDLLGDAFIAIELPSQNPKDHSVLTEQRDEPSVARVIDFLRSKLG
ncbi:MAG: dienelactone hydrolase [Ilumatobacteraceae bacterium]|nr:dienelactone hydrolase [Ilumatobacteraceae bacterium]